jgi:ATP-dependent Clp protease ATP-binding subunit ClpA
LSRSNISLGCGAPMWSAGLDFRGEVAMFEDFSERARRIVFFSRRVAGRRGASTIEVEYLIEALILEDQADYAQVLSEGNVSRTAVARVAPHRPFFTAEVAAEIQRGLEPLMLSKAKPLPESVDMPVSDAGQRLIIAAKNLCEELRGEQSSSQVHEGHVQPLHMLAAALSDEASAIAEVLKRAGIAKEAAIAAIKTVEYS